MISIQEIATFLKNYDGPEMNIMEICGTHTALISENGIPSMLSPKIRLISGPGCPVCVTVASYIDKLVELSLEKGNCVVTFGDMLRVCGSKMSLSGVTAQGGSVKMVYSPFEIISMAKSNPDTTYIFAAVGFETTTPVYALLVEQIVKENIKNIKLLTALKTMPAVIDALWDEGTKIDGFIAPGNVSVITGSEIFEPIAKKTSLPFVVAGFEGEELLQAIYAIIKLKDKGVVKNIYSQAVTPEGNTNAKNTVNKYFMPYEGAWRGFGVIKNSAMVLREEYRHLDAGSLFLTQDTARNNGCRCKDVVCGRITPLQCPLFGKVCTPENPQGACMVSIEGSCYNYYVNKRV